MKTKKTIWKQLTLRIPPDVHQAIKVKAAEEDRTIAVIVEGLIRQYLVGGKRA
ncbi:MAG: toxin-antitoxin system HicB family antitoxin [Candidatus Paceibacterota bacterium]|jgi:predicted HicB family RNase H-like nuclease